jgi:hypothetical protein
LAFRPKLSHEDTPFTSILILSAVKIGRSITGTTQLPIRPSPTPSSIASCTTRTASPSLNVYGGSDYAVTSGGGDYTVHVVVGVDPDNRMYLLDLWRGRTSSDLWIEAWCDLVRKWRPVDCLPTLVCGQLLWSPEAHAARSGALAAFAGPGADQRQLELSETAQHGQHQAAVRRRGVGPCGMT